MSNIKKIIGSLFEQNNNNTAILSTCGNMECYRCGLSHGIN